MAQAITSTCTYTDAVPSLGAKTLIVETPATADTGDTIVITLASYGISKFIGIYGMIQSTANSIIIAEAPTTSVTSGVLTITVGGSAASDQARTYIVWGH